MAGCIRSLIDLQLPPHGVDLTKKMFTGICPGLDQQIKLNKIRNSQEHQPLNTGFLQVIFPTAGVKGRKKY